MLPTTSARPVSRKGGMWARATPNEASVAQRAMAPSAKSAPFIAPPIVAHATDAPCSSPVVPHEPDRQRDHHGTDGVGGARQDRAPPSEAIAEAALLARL